MNVVKKIINFIKNIFTKQDEAKMLESPKEMTVNKEVIVNNKRDSFISSLKVSNKPKKQCKIEILTCVGDGTGFNNKLEC